MKQGEKGRRATRVGVAATRTVAILALGVGACSGDGAAVYEVISQDLTRSISSGTDTQIVENELTDYSARDRVSVRGDGSGQAPVMVGLVKWDVPTSGGSSGSGGSGGGPGTGGGAGKGGATCSTITSASITIDVKSTSNQSFNFYPANRAWVHNQANWIAAEGSLLWGVPGAMDSSDRGPAIQAFTPSSLGPMTIALNATGVALVQSWISSSSQNKGIVVGHETHADGFAFASFQAGGAARPKLSYSCN